jgi:hypothetical protein
VPEGLQNIARKNVAALVLPKFYYDTLRGRESFHYCISGTFSCP